MAVRQLWGTCLVFWFMGTQALPRGEVTMPKYSPGEDREVAVPKFSQGEDGEVKMPEYSPGEDREVAVPKYSGEDREVKMPEYSPGEDREVAVPKYSPGEDGEVTVPELSPGEDGEVTVPELSPGEDGEVKMPKYSSGEDREVMMSKLPPGQDGEVKMPKHSSGEDREVMMPKLSPGEDGEVTVPKLPPGQDGEVTVPELSPGEDGEVTVPELSPGEDGEVTVPELSPGEDGEVTVPELSPGEDGEVTVPELSPGEDGEVMLRLPALGEVMEFQLFPDHTFLAPGVPIRHVGRDGADKEGTDGLRDCFYSSRGGLAAFSLCSGVRGAFLRGQDRYVVQPLRTLAGRGAVGQHVVYKAGNAGQIIEEKDRGTERERGEKRRHMSEDWGRSGSSSSDRGHPTQEVMDKLTDRRTEMSISHTGSDPRARQKRFVSSERFLEILLVADTSMVQFYGEDLKLHLLTLMSVASRIYKHPSLRNSVNLVVVKVLVIEDEDRGPEVSDNGGLTLRNFCRWQQRYNPSSDRNPEHYDTAILFTRQDLCGHESCDTLGLADIGTVCDPSKSCSVIEDNGLQAAYTLAHELAHVLSIPHDNSNNCRKVFGVLDRHHLMAPLVLQLNKSVPWSPCSAMHLTEFFDSGHGDCLLDAPSTTLDLPQDLPGTSAQYDLDNQCRQVFGKEFSHCPNTRPEDICAQLWCKIQEDLLCHTKNGSLPWADGTPCGDRRVCWDGVCQEEEHILSPKVPVDGNWGTWGSWGECSRSCGGGVRFSYRECNDPEPENGGKYCQGQRAIYESCNTQECPFQEKSFREVQCEKYNAYNYTDRHGNFIQWIPKYSGVSPRDRCKLMCRARGGSEFNVFQPKVVDGTLCGPESLSVCVQGQCIKAGCDHVLHSSKKLDKCAVCGGDGSSCRKISGSLNKSKYGYTDVVTIPAGATNIDVKQRSHRGIVYDGIYLAIKTADGSYLLNGDYAVSSIEQDVHLRGTVLLYSGSNTTLERLQSFQPLPEPLTIQILRVAGESVPPKIKYTFFVPKNLPYGRQKAKDKVSPHSLRPLITAQWFLGDWSPCSKSCGSGWKRRTVECRNVDGGASDQCPQELRPEDIRACGDLPCPMWRVGGWSHCSQSCGEGVRTQKVSCVDYTGKETEDDKCDPKKRPAEFVAPCNLEEC